ncbi:MAG: transcriptional coactivator p15/PC4 family protein [Candidatus Heimdallarchaeaceae archaeon]
MKNIELATVKEEALRIEFVNPAFTVILLIPAILSLLKLEILKAIGYFIFAVGSVSTNIYEKIVEQKLFKSLKFSLNLELILHSFFGQFLNFYEKFSFWDKLLHFYGSLVITLFFFYTISEKSKFWNNKQPGIVLLAFLLGVFSGVLWEFAEFITDKLFSYNTQRGLDNTMYDLIFDCLGAYLASKVLHKKFTGRYFWHPKNKLKTNIRVYYDSGNGEYRPSRKGIAIRTEMLDDLIDALNRIKEEIEEKN